MFVNTLFSCLATVSERFSFAPVWKPPFISKLAAEDRCHLNGLAAVDGEPKYVTCVSKSDAADGWREHRRGGGLVLEVPSGEVVASGLSMPHSPRFHAGKLWLHDSGTGYFGFVDQKAGKFEPVAFCRGYLRGLDFVGRYAVCGMSLPREGKTFSGLPLDDNLKAKSVSATCGINVIDLKSGDVVHWLHLEGIVQELYDVITMQGARRPMAIGFKTDEIRRVISVGPEASIAGAEPAANQILVG